MAASTKSLVPGYIILNVLRVMNIIGLLAVICGCVATLATTDTITKFFFFDAVSHVVTLVISIFLIASELSLFRSYYARNWPLLSTSHGFVTLGLAMIVLGVHMLGGLNHPSTEGESINTVFERIVLGGGIVVIILGFFNIIASYIFRDRTHGITSRQVRAHGAVAVQKVAEATSSATTTPRTPEYSRTRPFHFGTRRPSLPSYHTSPASVSPAREKRRSFGPKIPINISAPLQVNPQFAHLVRPDVAHHPSQRGNRF